MRIALAVGILMVCISSQIATAETGMTIQTLLQDCNADAGSTDSFLCVGKVSGIGEMMGLNGLLIFQHRESYANFYKFSICPGKPTPTIGAQLQVFKNWARIHPERWAEQDFVGVIVSLREAWPCRL